jgi:hypothetical protein
MFGVILYIASAFGIAALLSFLYIVTRPIHARGELKSWYVFSLVFALALSLPYGAFEIFTKKFERDLKPAVQAAMDDAGIEGDMAYFKVLYSDGKTAKVMAVGEEKNSWGGTDRPVVRISLAKNPKGKWKADTYFIISSDNRNKDGVVYPPFW